VNDQRAIKRAIELGGLDSVRTVRDDVLASIAYGLDGMYDTNRQSAFVLVYNIGPSSIEAGIVEVEEGVFEVMSTLEDKSINDDLLQSELIDQVRELYPELRDVETSQVSVSIQFPTLHLSGKPFSDYYKVEQGNG
jgi:molecular chaperone DnaK (HSP70)